jgi:putative spermidine/putrescine transport system ATP-binding protein/spermidine/putrescine transport system ATP-binding protein
MTDSVDTMVQFKGIFKRFDKVVAVEKIDLEIEKGSLVTLLGPSGCGKTTLLRMIAGLETPTEGDIFVKGKRINDVPIHKRNLGMIFQNYALFPHKTIYDNIAFGLKYRNVKRSDVEDRVKRALEMVRLPGVEERFPSQLSGGQQQRIALARAIVIEPDVLLMDEPLSALDENLREEMRREIDNLQQILGVTTIFVTHDQREALSMSDKIVVMKDGKKLQEGPPEAVYSAPENHFVADFLGHSNFLDGEVTGRKDEWTVVTLKSGQEVLSADPLRCQTGESVEIVVRAQNFRIGSKERFQPGAGTNCFFGRVKDRSYMGGEIRYVVETDNGNDLHVINMADAGTYRTGQEVALQTHAVDCRILKSE